MTFYDSNLRVNPAMHEAAWNLATKWLSNPPIGNFLPLSLISLYVSSCFSYCFPSFFGCFPCFPWYFLLFSVLGLTIPSHIFQFSKHKTLLKKSTNSLLIPSIFQRSVLASTYILI